MAQYFFSCQTADMKRQLQHAGPAWQAAWQAVYVLDPDAAVRDGVAHLLEGLGITVRAYPDGRSFLEAVNRDDHGCALVDSQLPDLNGLSVLTSLRKMGNAMPVLLLTNSRNDLLERFAIQLGAACVIHKPMNGEQLLCRLAWLMHPTPPGLVSFRPEVCELH
jgi:FixJ family two-component response regulator